MLLLILARVYPRFFLRLGRVLVLILLASVLQAASPPDSPSAGAPGSLAVRQEDRFSPLIVGASPMVRGLALWHFGPHKYI